MLMVAVAAAGCDMAEAPVSQQKAPRPVTVIELKRTVPRPASQLTGSVVAWKTEQIGFQVPGRVESVVEPGLNIRGRTVDENNQLISEGTVIAQLEQSRYDLQVSAAQAQQETAGARAEAKKSELDNILPQKVAAAKASVKLAEEEHSRTRKLFDRGVATQSDLDRAVALLATAKAELDGTVASEKVTKAEWMSLRAQEKEAGEKVLQAQKDLSDTLLRSPFNGQVAEVHEIPGGYVQAGERVVTVQMMDPIAVEVAVSANTDSRLNYSDVVSVYLPDSPDPLDAMVYEKDTIADAATRTFNITLLVRNEQVEVGLSEEERLSDVPRVRLLVRLFTETRRREPPYYINVDALHQDDQGYFVFRVANATQADRTGPDDAKIELQKVRVTPGEKRLPFLQVATMRELTDIGDLDPEKDLMAGGFFTRDGQRISSEQVAANVQDGATVPYVRERWMLRPGDIVQVELQTESPAPGFYVPSNVILDEAGKKSVFVTETTGDTTTVKRLPVRVLDAVDTMRRIEAAGDEELQDGMRIVDQGALFLVDGEAVSVSQSTGAGQ